MQNFLKLFLASSFFFGGESSKNMNQNFVVAEVMIKFIPYTIVEERQGMGIGLMFFISGHGETSHQVQKDHS